MIVQTIEISLSKGRAPELLAHLGESNRQIEMIPDVMLPETAGAEIDIVKPDGTFAIQTAAITDGHIIVTLPDQACTVKGLSHYILKITDTGTVIYSAYGNIFVDDHLITDELIESVAAVNGHIFPDDFALKTDVQNIIDDTATSDEKTWSSEKIETEILHNRHNYSLNEQIVGTWIDGSVLYEITVHTGELPAGDVYKAHGISNFGKLVYAGGSLVWNGKKSPLPLPSRNSIDWNIAIADVGSINIVFEVGSYYSGSSKITDSWVTLRYTKTA